MLTTSIVLGSLWTLFLWKDRGEELKVGIDLVFWAVPGLFVGAKLVYHLQFGFPERLSDLWGGGIALYVGFFGILTPCIVVYLIRPYNVLIFLDCVTPGLALDLVLTRIGGKAQSGYDFLEMIQGRFRPRCRVSSQASIPSGCEPDTGDDP